MSGGYCPELDSLLELNAQHASYFQDLISVLQWIVKLSRINIFVPVAHMSQYLILPCKGHLEQVLQFLVNSSSMGDPPLCLVILLQTSMKPAL